MQQMCVVHKLKFTRDVQFSHFLLIYLNPVRVKEELSSIRPAGKLELNYFQCFFYSFRESYKIPRLSNSTFEGKPSGFRSYWLSWRCPSVLAIRVSWSSQDPLFQQKAGHGGGYWVASALNGLVNNKLLPLWQQCTEKKEHTDMWKGQKDQIHVSLLSIFQGENRGCEN